MDLAQNLRTIFSVLFGRPTFNIKTAEEAGECIQEYIQEIGNEHREMKKMVDLMTSTLNGTGCLIWRKDAEGRYLFANRAMINIFWYARTVPTYWATYCKIKQYIGEYLSGVADCRPYIAKFIL